MELVASPSYTYSIIGGDQMLTNGRYNLHGDLFFTTEDGTEIKMTVKDALEVAYTLFDSVGHSYKELEAIEEELEK